MVWTSPSPDRSNRTFPGRTAPGSGVVPAAQPLGEPESDDDPALVQPTSKIKTTATRAGRPLASLVSVTAPSFPTSILPVPTRAGDEQNQPTRLASTSR